MKTLHIYLTRQVVATLLMTVLVFTSVLLLGIILREVLSLFVQGQASPLVLLEAVGLLLPFVWMYALPMGMLTATLLVFGRFSADNELTAARASGISLLALATPILILSLLLSGVCAAINLEIAPRCRTAYKSLGAQLKAGLADMRFPEGRYIKDFDGYIIYIGKNRNQELQDVMVVATEEDTTTTIRAPRGRISKDAQGSKVIVELFDPKSVMMVGDHAYPGASSSFTLTLDIKSKQGTDRTPKISEMTFSQLRAELKGLEGKIQLPLGVKAANDIQADEAAYQVEKALKDITSPIRVQMHQQVASSFACFGFALVGIPLAIRVHRRETNIGFAMSLVLVFVYYAFMFLVGGLSESPQFAPHLIAWLPNFIFLAVGTVLLWRTNRGG